MTDVMTRLRSLQLRRPRPTASVGAGDPAPRRDRQRMLQLTLLTAGTLLMPAGITVIAVGAYGVAHSKYAYDQTSYLVSGGLLGLGLVLLGGFLYFGAWLARIADDQRTSNRQVADALTTLVQLAVQQRAAEVFGDAGELVTVTGGSTVHRRDCALIADRADLHPVDADARVAGAPATGTHTCRVCRAR